MLITLSVILISQNVIKRGDGDGTLVFQGHPGPTANTPSTTYHVMVSPSFSDILAEKILVASFLLYV